MLTIVLHLQHGTLIDLRPPELQIRCESSEIIDQTYRYSAHIALVEQFDELHLVHVQVDVRRTVDARIGDHETVVGLQCYTRPIPLDGLLKTDGSSKYVRMVSSCE